MAKRVLIVDEDQQVVSPVSKVLNGQGYKVFTAGDGETALQLVQTEKPDLIIMEILLAGLDGYEVANILQSNPDHKDIPIIMLTACKRAEDRQGALDEGVVAYLVKPFKMPVLVGLVKGILG